MLTPEIDRAGQINGISLQMDRCEKEQQQLIQQISRASDDPKLFELCFKEKVFLATHAEILEAEIHLLKKAIRKLEFPPIDDVSCSTSSLPSQHFDLLKWFEKKLEKKLAQLKNDAKESVETYAKERNASLEVQQNFLEKSIENLDERAVHFIDLFENTEKTVEGMKLLLREVESKAVALEEEKDRVSQEILTIAEPILDLRADAANLEKMIRQLAELRKKQHQLELKPEEELDIFQASQFGQLAAIQKAIANGSLTDFNVRDKRGYTMLHIAAFANQFVIVDFLLKQGANPSLGDLQGNYLPIFWAANRGAADIARRLHQAGSPISPLGGVAEYRPPATLFNRNPSLTTRSIDRTPLHTAVYKNHHRIMRVLLELGANLNAQTDICDHRKTPLIEAILLTGSTLGRMKAAVAAAASPLDIKEIKQLLNRCFKTFKILLDRSGIDLQLQTIDEVSGEEKTALHHAIDIGVDTGAMRLIVPLLNYPSLNKSLYFNNKGLFKAILSYASKVEPKHRTSYKPMVMRELLLYKIHAKAEKLRQRLDQQGVSEVMGTHVRLIKENPLTRPSSIIRLLLEAQQQRELQVDVQVDKFEEREIEKLYRYLREQFPHYQTLEIEGSSLYCSSGHQTASSSSGSPSSGSSCSSST